MRTVRPLVRASRAVTLRIVQEVTGTAPEQVLELGRSPDLVRARFLACRLMREVGLSFPDIGAALERDHTAIMNAVRRSRELEKAEPIFAFRLKTALTALKLVRTAKAKDAAPVNPEAIYDRCVVRVQKLRSRPDLLLALQEQINLQLRESIR